MADDLFTGMQSSDDLIQHIKRSMDTKANDFHVSFGFYRSKATGIKHDAMVVMTTKKGEGVQKRFEGFNVKEIFQQVDKFLTDLNA